MNHILFSCPTVFLKRPIAKLLNELKSEYSGLLIPKDIAKGELNIHYDKIERANIHSVKTFYLPFFKYEYPIPLNPLILFKLTNIVKNYGIIHMWVPFYFNNILISIIKKIVFPNKRLIITIDAFPGISEKNYQIKGFMNFLFRVFYRTVGRIIYKIADYIFIYGESWKNQALKAGVPAEKIKILPIGVNTKTKTKTSSIRNEFNINKDTKIILFVGIINQRKGIDKIIEIANTINDLNIKFIIVGDGPLRTIYEKQVKKNNLNNKIIFTGFRHDVHNFYIESDLFLFPSKGEGLPGVLMESMIYELPIIATEIAGVKDLIKDNFNGFLCNYDDDNKYFVNKIRELLENESKRKLFIQNSKKKIHENYNWKKNFKKYLDFY